MPKIKNTGKVQEEAQQAAGSGIDLAGAMGDVPAPEAPDEFKSADGEPGADEDADQII